MRRVIFLFALLAGASSCTSCESCKSGSNANANANADANAATPATSISTGTTPSSPVSAQPVANTALDANASCRLLAREITQKACNCPQANKVGCCYFGLESVKDGVPPPHLDCSRGRTDWPAQVESKLCADTSDTAKATAIANCYASRDKLQCAKTRNGDTGAGLPAACEALFKMIPAK